MKMIRKQVYIEARQDKLLKERARRYRVTEADLIRRAIDGGLEATGATTSLEAWRRIERFIARRRGHGKGKRRSRRRWTRESLYDR
jgi:hypothetical protein